MINTVLISVRPSTIILEKDNCEFILKSTFSREHFYRLKADVDILRKENNGDVFSLTKNVVLDNGNVRRRY